MQGFAGPSTVSWHGIDDQDFYVEGWNETFALQGGAKGNVSEAGL